MTRYLAPETPLDRALWCVAHHRTHELDVRQLDVGELHRVRRAVRRHGRAASAALVRAQAVAAITGLAIGGAIYAAFGIGPAAAVTRSPGGGFAFHPDNAAVLWLPLLALMIVVAFTGDRVVRSQVTEIRRRRAVVADLRAASDLLDAALDASRLATPVAIT